MIKGQENGKKEVIHYNWKSKLGKYAGTNSGTCNKAAQINQKYQIAIVIVFDSLPTTHPPLIVEQTPSPPKDKGIYKNHIFHPFHSPVQSLS
jgi:hypothetical protein